MGLPMSISMPFVMPPPMLLHAGPAPRQPTGVVAGCATKGCKGTVVAAGRRCLVCVRSSWVGRKELLEKQQGQDAKGAQLHSLERSQKHKRISLYPTYQCRGALLKDFGTLFHYFIEAQCKGNTQPSAQATFDFSGEYSVVAVDYDVVARKAAVALGVHDLKNAVARAGRLEFGPTSWVSILGKPGGVMTRFACVHLVNVYLPRLVYPAWTKSMQGELEIAVLPDDSHKYFSGEKTIVRFRLVG